MRLRYLHHQTFTFCYITPSLIGSTNDTIFLLTNRRVVLMGLKVHSYIVCCNAAVVPMYRLLIYTAAQCNTLHLTFTSLQYRNAVVGAETEIQPLQLNPTQLQWTMNESCHELKTHACSRSNSHPIIIFHIHYEF